MSSIVQFFPSVVGFELCGIILHHMEQNATVADTICALRCTSRFAGLGIARMDDHPPSLPMRVRWYSMVV